MKDMQTPPENPATQITRSRSPSLSQQIFLNGAMQELSLTAEQFAQRIGCPWDTFRKWLNDSQKTSNHREMPVVAWSLVREVIEHERLKNLSHSK